ncbi:DUF397 domain-containing protein [Streptomyces sp. NPDC088124]|uniref:DUF397 domain-containing protein n=1 Tax=Streptomyces sp. NPDC088124 TaxID=3154654 RepID=UPI003427D87E
MPEYEFVKSSYSGGAPENSCVEVARNIPGTVAIRDSKTGSGPILRLTPAAWRTFQTTLLAGHAGDGDGAGRARRG